MEKGETRRLESGVGGDKFWLGYSDKFRNEKRKK